MLGRIGVTHFTNFSKKTKRNSPKEARHRPAATEDCCSRLAMRREEKKGGHRPPATGDRARRPQGDDYKTPRKSRPQTGCYRRSCTSPAGRRLQNAKEKPATGRLLQKIVVAASLREAKKRKAA